MQGRNRQDWKEETISRRRNLEREKRNEVNGGEREKHAWHQTPGSYTQKGKQQKTFVRHTHIQIYIHVCICTGWKEGTKEGRKKGRKEG